MTIVEFLVARLDEDEAAARAASVRSSSWKLGGLDPEEIGDAWWLRPPEMEHAFRHDPARVLAQVAAMRAIVELHGARTTDYLDAPPEQSCRRCGKPDEYPVPFPCRTLRHLAAIWRDHAQYDPAWAPEGG